MYGLTRKQQSKLESLSQSNLKTGKAYRLKLALQAIYKTATDRTDAMIKLNKWYQWAVRSRIEPIKDLAKTIKKNWSGILNYFDTRLTNGVLEGINSLVQAARARAKGYRNINNYITMIYLIAGKLTFNLEPKMEM